MNNKKLENMLNDIVGAKVNTANRTQITTSIDSELLEDFRELCKALRKNFNVGFESMISLLINNEDFLKAFLDEIGRR